MRVKIRHLFIAWPYPFLNYNLRGSCHDQRTYPVMPESVRTGTFQPKLAKQCVKTFIQNRAVNECGVSL